MFNKYLTSFLTKKLQKLKSYNAETQPLIPFYETRGILFNVDGMQEIEKVSEDIKKVLSEF